MRSDNQIENLSQRGEAERPRSASATEEPQFQQLQQWLEKELANLEVKYADFITNKSTMNSFGR